MSGVAREERLAEVTIRRDLKEVREQSPPGPEAGAGRSRSGQWEECSLLSAEQDVRAGQTGPPT